MASVPLDVTEIAASGVARSAGDRLALTQRWTPSTEVCAPFRFTMVALTWRGAEDADVALTWGGGFALAHGDRHDGPDRGSIEDLGIQGTSPVWTGERRCLHLKLRGELGEQGTSLRDLAVTFLNTSGTAQERGALASIGSALGRGLQAVAGWMTPAPAHAMTNRPGIITRAQWGADESLRNCGPDYMDEVRVAYVHHTATGNSYSMSKADDIVRGIYAYHTNSRGYCDIAYHFLVDKWGRIYEGRGGGIDQPVQGGHAMGFNTRSVGIAAIGNFSNRRAPDSMVGSFRRLIRWRMDVAHYRPTGRVWMTSAGGSNQKFDAGEAVLMRSVVGHRRTGYTTCPGDRLVRRIKAIRKRSARGGHPKVYQPSQSAEDLVHGQGEISWAARISVENTRWYVDITDELGMLVRSFTAVGRAVAATWDGTDENGVPVPDGTYDVKLWGRRSGEDARPATYEVRVCALADPETGLCPDP